jgi:hypothetical protein
MADKKISEMTDAAPATGAEMIEVVQGGVNKRLTTQQIADLGGGAVDSVNGDTGVVVLDATDVGADPTGSAAAVDANLTAHITDTTAAHDASAIGFTPAGGIVADNVQDAIEEIEGDTQAVNKVLVTGTTVLTSTAFGKEHLVSGTSADYTITLPTAVGNEGKMILFKGDPLVANFNKTVTIDGDGTETVDQRLSVVISTGGWCTVLARVTSGVGSWDVISFDQGAFIAWTPTFVGYSVTPTVDYRYKLHNRMLYMTLYHLTTGTGTGTTFTFTMPLGLIATYSYRQAIYNINNTTAAMGYALATGGSNVITCQATLAGGAWTNGTDRELLDVLAVNVN